MKVLQGSRIRLHCITIMFQCEEKIVLFDFKHGKMTPFGPRHAEGALSGYVSVHHASLSRLYHVLHLKSSFPSNFVAHVCHILVNAAFCLALKCSFHINFFLYFILFFQIQKLFLFGHQTICLYSVRKPFKYRKYTQAKQRFNISRG